MLILGKSGDKMKYFLDTTGTIPDSVGFKQYGLLHIVWLVIFIATLIIVSRIYKKSDSIKRDKIRKIVAGLIVFDEIWKIISAHESAIPITIL